MSDLAVSHGERGVIRAFLLDLPDKDLRRLTEPGKTDPNPQASVAMLVGLDWLEEGGFEIFDPDVLGDLGLAGYLVEGGGVARDTLTDAETLDATDGTVLLLYSRAFGGAATTLKPGPGVTHIGTYHEDLPPVRYQKLPGEIAAAQTTAPSNQTPAKSNPHLTVLLAILALPLAAIILGLIIFGLLQ